MALSARIEGLAEFRSKLAQLRRAPGESARAGHRELAQRAAREMQAATPVDTGTLRSTIRVEDRSSPLWTDVVVGRPGETEYLGHVEFGTVKMSARPFVRPAAGRAESAHSATMLREARRRVK